MKDKLLTLYTNRHQDFKNVRGQFTDADLHGPFLMSPNENYSRQKNPLLIVGQETYGWSKSADDLNKNMEDYQRFNVGKTDSYSSPFWNVTRKIEAAIGNEAYSCAWTNISKYDVDGGRAYGKYEIAISSLDNLLADEIKIIKPKVCMFFTGPAFDERIKNIFPDVSFQQMQDWSTRQLSQLKHPNLPELSFRTYHPKYLRRSGLEPKFINFINFITKSINNPNN